MNKAFEKILERLEDELTSTKTKCYTNVDFDKGIYKAQKIVQEVAEEYKDGWISCKDRLPEEYGEYLVWWTDITGKRYYEITEYEPENGWIGDIPQAVEGKYNVIAWQPLPDFYEERD